jgi:hypothetical protein
MVDLSLNARGVRDTAWVWRSSPGPVLRALRKQAAAADSVPTVLLRTVEPDAMLVDMQQAGEAAMDAMWRLVGHKGNPR